MYLFKCTNQWALTEENMHETTTIIKLEQFHHPPQTASHSGSYPALCAANTNDEVAALIF